MRTLRIQVQTTLDGYMAGPGGEQDWMLTDWSPDVGEYVGGLMRGVDTILLGRTLAEGFIPFWAQHPDMDGAEFFNGTHRVVKSDSLLEAPWDNATLARGPFEEQIRDLTSSDGGDVIAYGGAQLVSGLIGAGLADEIHLFVNPVSIGRGLPVFGDGRHDFRTHAVTAFDCGITALELRPR